jgi:hypothetical protein
MGLTEAGVEVGLVLEGFEADRARISASTRLLHRHGRARVAASAGGGRGGCGGSRRHIRESSELFVSDATKRMKRMGRHFPDELVFGRMDQDGCVCGGRGGLPNYFFSL